MNRLWTVASGWQTHVVWMRMNVAYIRAELPTVAAEGRDVSGLEALVASFDPVFEQFCTNEFQVFVSARRLEIDEPAPITTDLRRLRDSFTSWLGEYHGLVEQTESEGGLPHVLLLSCGAELMGRQMHFTEAVDAYLEEIDDVIEGP